MATKINKIRRKRVRGWSEITISHRIAKTKIEKKRIYESLQEGKVRVDGPKREGWKVGKRIKKKGAVAFARVDAIYVGGRKIKEADDSLGGPIFEVTHKKRCQRNY